MKTTHTPKINILEVAGKNTHKELLHYFQKKMI